MMKSFLAKIGAVLASLPRFVWERVCVAGEWVSRLIAVPAMPVEAIASPAGKPSGNAADDEVPGIKCLAGVLAQDLEPEPDHVKGLSDLTVAWMRSLDRRSLCVLLAAEPGQIRAHMRGKAHIKGMVPYEKEAIKDVFAARSRPAPSGKTLREALAEQGIHP